MDFFSAIQKRRSVYAITDKATVSDERIIEIVENAVKHTPSSYNSQAGRIVLLLGDNHKKYWDNTTEILRKIVPAENFTATENKMNAFKAGYGTILVFEDQGVVKNLQESYPAYKEKFPLYSEHSSGMLQYIIWTSLAVEGMGSSVQHYSPLVDEMVRKEWNVPENWKLQTQMPFGAITAEPAEKTFIPLEDRVKIFR